MDFAAKHGVPPLRYSFEDLEENAALLTVSKRDRRSRFIAAYYSEQAWLF
jgi:hypothetical protein